MSQGQLALLAALQASVGAPHVLTEPAAKAGFLSDWTGRFGGDAAVVVRPGSTAEVAEVVAVCARFGCGIVPQGGNTGLVGAGVPRPGATAARGTASPTIVLSLRRLADLSVDPVAGEAVAGAGVTVGELRRRVAGFPPWMYGIDVASRDSATVGGTIATNAGGLRVWRYGDTRAQLLGLEAVLGDGSVVSHLGAVRRDNTGYHWPALLCGSEGTLGVITRARLRLVPVPGRRLVALLAFESVEAAAAAAFAARQSAELEAAELMVEAGVRLVCDVTGSPPAFSKPHAAYLLLELASESDPGPALEELVAGCAFADIAVADVAVATDAADRRRLWSYREGHTAAINTLGPPHKLDVTVPAASYAQFVASIADAVRRLRSGAHVWLFGHAADGNVHVNITGLAPDDDAADDLVMRRVAELGGSISTEHGIGYAKRRWLALMRSPAELALFGRLKQACDPVGILNPGVLLPAEPGVSARSRPDGSAQR